MIESKNINIKPRERDAIIQSLRAGVVPRIGLQHIQVGRLKEVQAIIDDLDKIQSSGSTIRFVVGDFGSGKTFFLTLANILAHNKKIVSTKVDITLERTLYSRDGRGRATFAELMKNLSTRQQPGGGALKYILESWLSEFLEINENKRKTILKKKLSPLKEYVAGYDFVEVLDTYVKAYDNGDEDLMDSCLRWLRGEFRNISSARRELPNVKTFINDENYYEYLKLYASFFEIAGYYGFLIGIDELFNLTQQKSNVRKRNYETILKIINDSLQGSNRGLMFIFGGTPDFVFCERKGLYSYGALKTRLARNPFNDSPFKDFSGPLIELGNLSPEEYLQLFKNIRRVFAYGDEEKYLVSDRDLETYLKMIYSQLGAEQYMTARESIRHFVSILGVLEAHPQSKFEDILKGDAAFSSVEKEAVTNPSPVPDVISPPSLDRHRLNGSGGLNQQEDDKYQSVDEQRNVDL